MNGSAENADADAISAVSQALCQCQLECQLMIMGSFMAQCWPLLGQARSEHMHSLASPCALWALSITRMHSRCCKQRLLLPV